MNWIRISLVGANRLKYMDIKPLGKGLHQPHDLFYRGGSRLQGCIVFTICLLFLIVLRRMFTSSGVYVAQTETRTGKSRSQYGKQTINTLLFFRTFTLT